MPTQQLLLRWSCKASNAYSPSVALHSAFSSASRNHEHATKSRRTPAAIDRDLQSEQSQLARVVQSPDASATTSGGTGRGKGGFADYEALRGSFGVKRSEEIKTKEKSEGLTPNRIQKGSSSPSRGQSLRERLSRRPSDIQRRPTDIQRARDSQDLPRRQTSKAERNKRKRAKAATGVDAECGDFWIGSDAWQAQMISIATTAHNLSKEEVKFGDRAAIDRGRYQVGYKARYVAAPQKASEQFTPIPWAVNRTSFSGLDSKDILEQEIDNFARYADATPAERAARQAVVTDLMTYITDTIPGVQSTLSGSEMTGLATSTSDIDVQLSFRNKPGLKGAMVNLFRSMQESTQYMTVVLRAAKYHLISAQHRATGIDIQIVAAPATAPQQKLTRQYLEELPHLRSLYLLLRTTLGTRGLIDVFSGGIGSYGLFMMLVASLKRRSSDPPATAADQLKRFFDFYSSLDMRKHAVSLTPDSSKLFKKHDAWSMPIKANTDAARRRGDDVRAAQWSIGQRRLYQPYLFCLQDPADPLNDLGRKSNAIRHLQATIATLRMIMFSDDRYQMDESVLEKIHSQEESLLLPLVGRCHEIYAERRKKVEEYGLERLKRAASQEEDALSQSVEAVA